MTTSQHIGAAGELLTQYKLLKLGIDSARLTTDSGIDLVAYPPDAINATTIQVKTQAHPAPAGGVGALTVGFVFPETMPAQLLALVLLSTDQVWLLPGDAARALAQQHSPTGNRRLYWYLEPLASRASSTRLHAGNLESHLIEQSANRLLGATDPPQSGALPPEFVT